MLFYSEIYAQHITIEWSRRLLGAIAPARALLIRYEIANSTKDDQKHIYYEIADIEEWDFPVNQYLLPSKYTNLMTRIPCTVISEKIYYELLGIRNISQNLKINYKNILKLLVSEKDIETLIDTENALRSNGLEIIDRQLSITPGNIIDLLCKDSKGDLVVVE